MWLHNVCQHFLPLVPCAVALHELDARLYPIARSKNTFQKKIFKASIHHGILVILLQMLLVMVSDFGYWFSSSSLFLAQFQRLMCVRELE